MGGCRRKGILARQWRAEVLIHSCRYPCGKGRCHSTALPSVPGLMAGTREQQLRFVSPTGAFQLAPVRRAEAPEEAGHLHSFILLLDVSVPSTPEKCIFFYNVCKGPKFGFYRVLRFSSVEIRGDE